MDEKHYCLVKLSECQRSFTQLRSSLPKARAKYEKHKGSISEVDTLAELHKSVLNLWKLFPMIIQLLSELDAYEQAATAHKLYDAVKRFDYLGLNDYSRLCSAIEVFEKSLPTEEQNLNTKMLGRFMNRVKMGYFPTDLNHVELIKQAIAFPETEVNILDPCCGCGLALSTLCNDANAVSFGVELDEGRAEESQERLNRVAVGSFFSSRVSHEAFHCIFLNPPYLSVMTEGGGNVRMEKSFLAGSIPHLMMDGLLIYIVPYYRMSEDICRVLCENFYDISIYRFADSEFKKFRQIAILGKRKTRSECGRASEKLLNSLILPDNIPYLSTIKPELYSLPLKEKKVDLFKGAVFNVRELSQQLQKSKTTDILFEYSKLEDMEKRPPLPLNVSQIGLVGGSGLLNGLLECDMPHIIKGRVIKQHKSSIEIISETDQERKRKISTISSNKLVFNILTPDGFKSLT